MKKKSLRDAELYTRCGEVLHYLWDPIGVAGCPGARGEYDSYLPRVFELVQGEATAGEIADYLTTIESGSMGLTRRPEKAAEAAQILLDWRDWVHKRSS